MQTLLSPAVKLRVPACVIKQALTDHAISEAGFESRYDSKLLRGVRAER